MKKFFLYILFVALIALFAGCDGCDTMDSPFTGLDDSPPGSDIMSASTNRSGKEGETSPQLNGLAGAAYVAPPQINNYGTVNLGYSVETPAGRAGMQPSVGLSYSSSGGDGLAGIGWSLGTGLGVISRTTRNGQLHYDYRDVFTFNGKRLVKVEGPSSSENGVYRLEIESGFSRFELHFAESGGTWYVYDKTGTVTVYGEELSSRIYHPQNSTRTYTWNFSRSTDLNGNYMQAVYDDDDYADKHILYLSEIRYTGNDKSRINANQYVRFHYKEREESYVSSAPGFVMEMDRLLDYIEVGWDDPQGLFGSNTELWRYTMVYHDSPNSGRPMLYTVESTRNTTMPEFNYSTVDRGFLWETAANPDYNSGDYIEAFRKSPEGIKYFEGDFNGDGISDMVFFNPQTGRWRAAEGNREGGFLFKDYSNSLFISEFRGLDSDQEIQWFKGGVTGDYNGDGRSDIAFYLPKQKRFWVAEHTGQIFNFRPYSGITLPDIDIFKCEWFSGDYDGNGLTDAVLFNEPTGEWIYMRNTGGGFQFIKFNRHFKNLFRDDYNPDDTLNSASTNDRTDFGRSRYQITFLSGDFNGDGRTDIGFYDARSGKWWVAENYIDNYIGFNFQWKLYKEFTQTEKKLYMSDESLFCNDTFSGDFNGDGYSDFLVYKADTRDWVLGESRGGYITFRKYSKMPDAIGEIARFLQGDFNGDGRTDVAFYSPDGRCFWVGEATPGGFSFYIYTNLNHVDNSKRPDPEKVLDNTPLPKNEVIIQNRSSVVVTPENTVLINYNTNINTRGGQAETVFPGNYRKEGDHNYIPEILIYKRDAGFFCKSGNDDTAPQDAGIEGLDPNDADTRILNNGVPMKRGGLDALYYYKEDASVTGQTLHQFNAIANVDGKFETIPVADFDQSVIDFDIDSGFYLIDDFTGSDNLARDVLVYDAVNQGFVLFNESGPGSPVEVAITAESDPGLDLAAMAEDPSNYRMFSGRFTNAGSTDPAQVLIVQMNSHGHSWFLGEISSSMIGSSMTIESLESDSDFKFQGYEGFYSVTGNGSLIYASGDSSPVFYMLDFTYGSGNGGIEEVASFAPSSGAPSFAGEFDRSGNPVYHTADGIKYANFTSATPRAADLAPDETTELPRDDLFEDYYPYRWIQGDYNGDGKTDIGIFHLLDQKWYFANTRGEIPDVMIKVDNGIGGTYSMDYINSTTLDNTGGDSIPDLPMNYKVCARLEVDDGFNRRIVTKYEYKNGCAFSSFIDGYKETDYFGFGEFTVTDALGGKTISTYNSIPYDDFRENRALSGAISTSRFIGSDSKEYTRTEYEYLIHRIQEQGQDEESFLVEPVEVRKYETSTLVSTTRSNIELAPGKYEMLSRSESVTDHYSDDVHSEATVTALTEFENIEETNEMRVKLKRALVGTPNQTTTAYEYYDETGNLKKETLSYTGTGLGSPADRSLEYEYDACGNMIAKTNTSGSPARRVEMKYDGRLSQYLVEEKALGDGIDLVTTYTRDYRSAFGAVLQKRDPGGNSTYFEYDDYGRLARQYTDTDEGKELLNEYEYGAQFPLNAKVARHSESSTLSDRGMIESRVYVDGLGRAIHSVQSAQDLPGKKYVKTGFVVYDVLGRIVRKSQTGWARDDEIDVFRQNEQEKNPTRTEYDAAGRVSRVVFPLTAAGESETSLSYAYNGPWETVETHSVGRSKRTVKNARSQVLYVQDSGTGDPEPGSSADRGPGVTAMIGFAYDIAGNRVKKMDLSSGAGSMSLQVDESLFSQGVKDLSGSNVAQWKYDGFGQLVCSSDPDLGYSATEYNAFGQPVSVTDALGRTTAINYDRLGRIVLKELPGSEGEVAYKYDSLPGSENATGRLVSVVDPAQVKVFSYDRAGRVKHEERTINQAQMSFSTDFTYDLMNRAREILYPADPATGNRLKVEYGYCPMGVSSIGTETGGASKSVLSGIEYNEFGQMSRIVRGNGAVTNYEYDIRGRLSRLVTTAGDGAGARKIQDVAYSFKLDNSIRSVTNTPDTSVDGDFASVARYDYSYDGLNRLVHATGNFEKAVSTGGSESKQYELGYSYAPNGNLTDKLVFDPASHTIEDRWAYGYVNHAATSIDTTGHGVGRFTMEYDAAGNMVYQEDRAKGMKKRIEYDSSNRISTVTDPATGEVVGSYQYDDQGFRVRRESVSDKDGQPRRTEVLYPSMYFGLERAIEEEGLPSVSVNNIYLNGVRVAAIAPDSSARYYLTDQVDSVKVVLDDEARPVSSFEYLPYGETWIQEGDDKNNPKFNSQELDKETGFYFYNARHYDPEIARFVTADSVVPRENDTQSWNRFSYCSGNPIRYSDPTGHEDITQNDVVGVIVQATTCPGNGSSDQVIGAVTKSGDNLIPNYIDKQYSNDTPDQYVFSVNGFSKDELDKLVKDVNDNKAASQSNIESTTTSSNAENATVLTAEVGNRGNTEVANMPGAVTSGYGYRRNNEGVREFHNGIDRAVPNRTPLPAMRGGRVVFSGRPAPGTGWGGYGNIVVIDHGNGLVSFSGHHDENTVQRGDVVNTGDIIGYSGDTDSPGSYHSHTGVMRSAIINPDNGNINYSGPSTREAWEQFLIQNSRDPDTVNWDQNSE